MVRVRFKDLLNDYLQYSHITNKEFANRIGITQKHLIDILFEKQWLLTEIIEKFLL